MAKVFGALSLLLGSQLTLCAARPLVDIPGLGDLQWTDIHWPESRPIPEKITKSSTGQLIGWVRRDAQNDGIVATPPPPKHYKEVGGKKFAKSELASPLVEKGPEGTVPFQILTKDQVQKIPQKGFPPTHNQTKLAKRQSTNGHWYGNSEQEVQNWGGSAYVSLFDPAVAGGSSMSLIQVAITNGDQTAELGWQVLPSIHNGDTGSYIFTYYTTNGYTQGGDNTGCYNALCEGWTQVSSNYAPGMTFSTISQVGGSQYEVPIDYQFQNGNWWASVNGEQMGYYTGSMYANNGNGNGNLGDGSTALLFYGEIYDPFQPPTTDMGSGQFASTGFGNAGYMHNIQYYSDDSGTLADYNGNPGETNSSFYTIAPTFQSGTSWGSYFYVGGPGSG